MKAKLDSAQVKSFLLHHVEKIVFGGFVVAFLLISWSAFKLKPYDKTPENLKKTADEVSQQVESKTPPEKFDGLPSVPDFTDLGAVGPAAVDPRFYAVTPMNLPYEERQELRKEPKFLALLDLQSYAGFGGIAIGESGKLERNVNFGSGAGDPMGGSYMPSSDAAMPPGDMMGSSYQPPGYGSDPTAGGSMPGYGGGGSMPGYGGGGGPMGPGGGGAMGPGYGGNQRQRQPSARERRLQKEAERRAAAAAKAAQKPRPKPQSAEKIALADAPAGSHVEGRHWICLVGAIPYFKQLNEYQNTFRDARQYDIKRDYPRYVLPRIERAEVHGNKVGKWEELDLEEAVDDLYKWAAEYPEVVDKQFLDPDLTEPLPPLVFANHDKEKVVHPLTKVMPQKPVVEDEEKNEKKQRPRSLTGGARGGSRMGARPGMGPGYGGYGGYGGMQGQTGSMAPLVEYRLFRFFDFKVESGKSYRYRVKLVLRNPNAGVPPRFVENKDYTKGDSREADWSEPSPEVTVIAGNRLLAGTVSPGRSEPTGHLLAKLFDSDLAAEIRRIFDISRGSVLNEPQAKVSLREGNNNSKPKAATLDFLTNAVVLDMFGGEKIPGARAKSVRDEPPKVPGHFLVLDNDGDLRTLAQPTDAGMYETEAEEAEQQRASAENADNQRPGANNSSAPAAGFENFDLLETNPKRRGR
jgi:hypothetical protein